MIIRRGCTTGECFNEFGMKRLILYSLVMMMAMSFIGGCAVSKILRSEDPELIYNSAIKFKDAAKWSRAYTLFESVEHFYVGSTREDSITFYRALCKYRDRDYSTASDILEEFRRKFGRSVFIEDAECMYALCYYYMSPGPTRDQALTSQALQALSEFIVRYPESEHVENFGKVIEELTARMYDKSYNNAYTYYRIGYYNSAMVALRNALREYPESHRREELMYLTVKSAYRLADNSVADKQHDRFIDMLDAYYTFVDEFPESHYRRELDRLARNAKDFIDKNSKDND